MSLLKNYRIYADREGRQITLRKRADEVDVRKCADGLLSLAKRGEYTGAQMTVAMQKLADVAAKQLNTFDRESQAQRFTRAWGEGEHSRIPRSAEIMRALSELSAVEKMHKARPFITPTTITLSPPQSQYARPPRGARERTAQLPFQFTEDTLTGPPDMKPRRPSEAVRVLGPGDDGHLPSYAEVVARLAATNPALYVNRAGAPNMTAHEHAMATPAGQDALERERARNLAVNAPP